MSDAAGGEEDTALRAELDALAQANRRLVRLVKRLKRSTVHLRRAVMPVLREWKKSRAECAHTFVSEELHLRVLFEHGDAFVAAAVRDARDQRGSWGALHPQVFIRKNSAAGALVREHALSFADVVRVTARVDAEVRVSKKRTVSGLYKTIGRTRTPRKCPAIHVTFDSLELVASYDSDVEVVRSLARSVSRAATAQLLSPNDGDPPEQALLKLGVSQADLRFAVAAVASGAGGAARLASDPRFAALRQVSRASVTNVAVRGCLDAVKRWKPDAEVLPPRKKLVPAYDAFGDSSLPVVLRPGYAETLGRQRRRLTEYATGAYASLSPVLRPFSPRAFVRHANGASVVVAYAYDFALHEGGTAIPAIDRQAEHAWVPPSLAVARHFAQRLACVAFDGDAEWSDEDLRFALGLANRVVWAFEEPEGERANRLMRRVHEFF